MVVSVVSWLVSEPPKEIALRICIISATERSLKLQLSDPHYFGLFSQVQTENVTEISINVMMVIKAIKMKNVLSSKEKSKFK